MIRASASRDVSARLLGCGFFEKHRLTERLYTGRAWFAQSLDTNGVSPFEDEEAHELANGLGLKVRSGSQSDFGTSLMILGFEANMEELRKAIENFWWPRIVDNELQIELWEDRHPLDPPRPRKRDDLKPFLDCYRLIQRIDQPHGDRERRGDLQPLHGIKLGSWAAKAIDAHDDNADEEESLLGRVALVRRPKMVVSYRSLFRAPTSRFAAAFVADDGIDGVLKLSEPPAHSEWDENSDRLTGVEHGNEIVRVLHQRIYFNIRRFVVGLTPPPPPKDGRLRALERELGQLLNRFAKLKPAPPPHGPEALHIETQGQKHMDKNGRVVVSWDVLFRLSETVEADNQGIRSTFGINVLADDNQTAEDELDVRLSSDDDSIIIDGCSAELIVNKQSRCKIKVSSVPYDSLWMTELVISAEPVNE